MDKQDKELLLKDLCARLPYKPQVVYNGVTKTLSTLHIFDMTHLKEECVDIKPYLRPMDSMTEKEKEEYYRFYDLLNNENFELYKQIDYLNAHHIDFRNLISMGLALPAPEGMYNL